jgi:hypothetical protein
LQIHWACADLREGAVAQRSRGDPSDIMAVLTKS